jgi:DNA-binding transcriptional ArsR family regulator
MNVRAPAITRSKPANQNVDLETLLGNARDASEFLKALSHEARLVILCMLIEGEKSVGEIEQILKLRQPAVSQQLARLRADGLVETRREGKNIYYSLARSDVREVIEALHKAFCKPKRVR